MLGQHKANSSKDHTDQHEEELHTINKESTNERYVHFSQESSHEDFQRIKIVSKDQDVNLVPEDQTRYISTHEDHKIKEIIESRNGLEST